MNNQQSQHRQQSVSITLDFSDADASCIFPEFGPGKGTKKKRKANDQKGESPSLVGNTAIDPASPSTSDYQQFLELGYHIPPSAARSRIPYTPPFTVLVDTREQIGHAWEFRGMFADSSKQYRPLNIATERQCLGNGQGDYSIKGMQPIATDARGNPLPTQRLTGHEDLGEMRPTISIERKAQHDAHSTFLGWGAHRENFEQELANLSGLTFAAVIIECTEGELISTAPEYGIKSREENAWTLRTSINAWRMQFPRVQWVFADDRNQAECTCYRLLERFFKEYVR